MRGVIPAASDHEQRPQEYEREMTELKSQLQSLEEEVVQLRRRLQDAPKRVRTLEERLLETKGQLAQALSQNEKLSATLREAREHIARTIPHCKIVCTLRDPVSRLYSLYRFMRQYGFTRASFERALEDFPFMMGSSRYAHHVRHHLVAERRADLQNALRDLGHASRPGSRSG